MSASSSRGSRQLQFKSDADIESEGFQLMEEDEPEQKTRKFTLEANYSFINNKVSHQKYTIFNVIPKFLFDQFKFFFNFFYLVITLTQFIPAYRIGFLVTYIFPLLFVLGISFAKEMWDEFNRWKRDRELNHQNYTQLTRFGPKSTCSKDLMVGDVICINSGERVPADLILLKTSDAIGASFIKTTQLDGETDWKLRRAISFTQSMDNVFNSQGLRFEVEQPKTDIYDFNGAVYWDDGHRQSITVENTIWADAVVASGSIIGVVVYTGYETRAAMNGSPAAMKTGKIDREINKYSSVLFALLFLCSFAATALNGFTSNFHVLLVRFVLLFSFIIPISMRMNLDTSKMVYSFRISHDKNIPGAILRSSTLPEELGRVEFLFTDKTGTLTKNEMEFKKLQIDNIVLDASATNVSPEHFQVYLSLALCHSVRVTADGFQSSSPDEIALVSQAAKCGFKLIETNDKGITIELPSGEKETFSIIAELPFSSVWRHMGIVATSQRFGSFLICKGADSSISKMCPPSEWLDEVVGNLAREGLRTLVYAAKQLSTSELKAFMDAYHIASTAVTDRGTRILDAFSMVATEMNLLGVTGVEDKLQDNVPETLEALEAANIKIWMLTGDKLETAICVALSSRLFSREVDYVVIKTFSELVMLLENSGRNVPPMVIDGTVLQQALKTFPELFVSVATRAPAVVVCRCSPSQKESVVRSVPNVVSCAVGDGGNDVSMIQAASVGIGIVGKEGKQASMSADVSINQFCHLQSLLLWHGTNAYKHSARLAQFVMHRGVIMTATQAIYSLLFNVVPSPLYNDWLMMGFATFFTMFPVFSLIFDEFVQESTVIAFPELYSKCQKGRYLSAKTFIGWVWLAIYQGTIIMFMTSIVFGIYGRDERHLQSIAFTSMIFTELVLVVMEINHVNAISVISELLSVSMYLLAMFTLHEAFDTSFICTWEFLWKTLLITAVCVIPLGFFQHIRGRIAPSHEEQLGVGTNNDSTHFFIL